MCINMSNVNITNFRKDIYNLLEQTIKYNEPLNISIKNGNAVVLSEEDYRNLIATLEIESNKKLKENSYQAPPPYEKLLGDLERSIFKKVRFTT